VETKVAAAVTATVGKTFAGVEEKASAGLEERTLRETLEGVAGKAAEASGTGKTGREATPDETGGAAGEDSRAKKLAVALAAKSFAGTDASPGGEISDEWSARPGGEANELDPEGWERPAGP
jgi:hypothetical protein